MYSNFIKPLFDFLFALLLLIVLSPVMLATIILLAIFNHRNVFFLQSRPGYRGKLFNIIKFKTMKDLYNEDGIPLEDEKRMTKVGKVLRKLSIDELPQLINVLKGDLSLVGPRPLLEEYLPLYSTHQARRHDVKPGITGWAQVNGRNTSSWEKRFELDIYYVDHQSLWLDLTILFKTFGQLFKTSETNADGTATMHKFEGNNKLNI